MLKTNSKVFNAKLDNYLINSVDKWLNDNKNYLSSDYVQILENAIVNNNAKIAAINILDCFYNEQIKFDTAISHYKKTNQLYRINLFNYFEEWCQGLPSALNCDFYYNVSAVQLLGDMLEQSEEQRSKYSERESEKALTTLLYNRLLKLSGYNCYSLLNKEA